MSETPTSRVADNVRAEMARRKVTQRDLAEGLGLSQASVSKRLMGAVPWDVNELAAVASLLGVELSVLVTTTAPAVPA